MLGTQVSSQDSSRRLNCLIEGESTVFVVTVGRCVISQLKKVIQNKRALDTLKDVGPHTLELWKPKDSSPIAAKPADTLVERIKSLRDGPAKFADKLDPTDNVFSIFSERPPSEHIHIIATRPPVSASEFPRLSIADEIPPVNLFDYLHVVIKPPLLPLQPPPMNPSGSPLPIIPPNFSLRRRTVEGLYDALMKERLIYVRGSPGSGKSTLLNLLHRHILEKHPKAFVRVTWSWKPQNVPVVPGQDMALTYLQAIIPHFSQRTSLTFLLMDDAQDSFRDDYLWNKFLKDITDMPNYYRVVVFCSYGSTTTPAKDTSKGIPNVIGQAARMTLWPREVREGVEVNGLLLDWNEFNEVVEQFDKELTIDWDLSQTIFDLTVGHVGAVCQLLTIILDKMKTRIQTEGPVTVDTYYEEFSLEYIMCRLERPSALALPDSGELERPEVSDVFRRLLVSGRVRGNDAATQYCHRKGWLYAEDQDEYQPQYYTFASPLHHAALSWRLQPMDSLPHFDSPYALSLEVIAKFKPSQLKYQIHRVGGGSTPPEAQYQDEYYRCLLAVTCGHVRITPEFASAGRARVARIDFFIPGVKWEIKITREGDRLNQHAARFKTSGAYGKWLKDGDMTDYILLDYRTTPLETSHPEIPNLYHVVFNKGYTEVCVFNNKRDQVWGPIALQENPDNYAMLL